MIFRNNPTRNGRTLVGLHCHSGGQLEGEKALGGDHSRIAVRRQNYARPRGATAGRADRCTLAAAGDRSNGCTDARPNADLRRILTFGSRSLTRR